jgi:predicted alpha/beta-fold hydrolase
VRIEILKSIPVFRKLTTRSSRDWHDELNWNIKQPGPRTFEAPLWLSSGYSQTVAGSYWPQDGRVYGDTARHLVSIGDDGHIAVAEDRPKSWRMGGPVVFLLHGLTGSENSPHIVRLANHFYKRGFLAIRMNMRGAGPGAGLARGLYHSGRSEDARAVLSWIGQSYPGSPVTQIGVSLGGNVTLKMAGEFGDDAPDFLQQVIAVSAPIDLAASSKKLSGPNGWLFDRYFAGRLVRSYTEFHRRYPDKIPSVPRALSEMSPSLARLDDIYLAPSCGFVNGQDYYHQCSSASLVPRIKPKLLLLVAADDPIIDLTAYNALNLSPHHQLLITNHGGHVGWVSRTLHEKFGRFWMDQVLVSWATNPECDTTEFRQG